MRRSGHGMVSKSRQHDAIDFWAFPAGLKQRCWLNSMVYSSGNHRNGEDKTLSRALGQKSACPATITSIIGWAWVAALLGQLVLFIGRHQTS
ncbi:hypothetical protein BD309DRAFT_954623 [Dichomitus squalens]|nr:hypothetical protein BD309DRAFT_954623 [Dichomitus squalens]